MVNISGNCRKYSCLNKNVFERGNVFYVHGTEGKLFHKSAAGFGKNWSQYVLVLEPKAHSVSLATGAAIHELVHTTIVYHKGSARLVCGSLGRHSTKSYSWYLISLQTSFI